MITQLTKNYKYIWVGGYSLQANERWTLVFKNSSLYYDGKEVRQIIKNTGQAPRYYDENNVLIHTEDGLLPTFEFVLENLFDGGGLSSHFANIDEIIPTLQTTFNGIIGIIIQDFHHYGEELDMYFIADNGYSLVNSQYDMTMGATDITSDYNPNIEKFEYMGTNYFGTHLHISSVTDDVIISMNATPIYDVHITCDIGDKGTHTFPSVVNLGDEIFGTLRRTGQHSFKELPRVIRGTTDITDLCEYTKVGTGYDIIIPPSQVYEDINIISNIADNPTITSDTEHSSISVTHAPYNVLLNIIVDVDDGYYISKDNVEVTINGTRIYDVYVVQQNNRFIIRTKESIVTGDIFIKVRPSAYNVFRIRNKNNELVVSHTAISVKKIYITREGTTNKIILDNTPYEYTEILEDDEILRGLSFSFGSSVIKIPYEVETTINLKESRTLYEVVTTLPIIPTDFKLYLYKNSAESNQVDKTDFLEEVNVISGVLRQGTTIIRPTIDVELSELPSFNYVWIPYFNRYYFVDDIQSINNKYWGISLRTDVLMSNKDIIRSQTCMIARQEFDYNDLLVDDKRVVQKDVEITTEDITIGTPFAKDRLLNNYVVELISSPEKGQIVNPYGEGTNTMKTKPTLTDVVVETDFNCKYALERYAIVSNLMHLLTGNTASKSLTAFFNDPKQYVLGLKVYPFDVTNWVTSVSDKQKIRFGSSTGYKDEYNFGKRIGYSKSVKVASFKIEKYFNDFMDYYPYTKVSIYLPYIGFRELPINEIIGKNIDINYIVDFDEGTIKCTIDDETRTILIEEGMVGVDIPFGSSNANERFRNRIANTIQASAGIISLGASASGGMASAGAITGGVNLLSSSLIKAINSEQEVFKRSQKLGSNVSSLLLPTSCYLIIERPKPIAITDSYNHIYGKPLGEVRTLSTLTGFTIVENVHLEGFKDTTDDEIGEIDSLLKQGVHL